LEWDHRSELICQPQRFSTVQSLNRIVPAEFPRDVPLLTQKLVAMPLARFRFDFRTE
jgi:hypothetical protein